MRHNIIAFLVENLYPFVLLLTWVELLARVALHPHTPSHAYDAAVTAEEGSGNFG